MTVVEASSNGGTPTQVAVEPPRLQARLVSIQVALQVVGDDGETLHPLRVEPIQVSAGDWPAFDVARQLADVQRQLDGRQGSGT
jgi:hypothetical protein